MVEGKIVLQNVTFGWNKEETILEDIDLTINNKDLVVIRYCIQLNVK